MNLTVGKLGREKTLLAIIFAGSVLSQPLRATGEEPAKSVDSVVQSFVDNTKASARAKGFYLLLLAHSYLTEKDTNGIEASYRKIAKEMDDRAPFTFRNTEIVLTNWTNKVSTEEYHQCVSTNAASGTTNLNSKSRTAADLALKEAIVQIDKVEDDFSKWNLYFIASKLFKKSGNIEAYERCNVALEKLFKRCEAGTSNGAEIKAVVSILNSEAYARVPLEISDRNPEENRWQSRLALKPFTNEEFQESEKLKLKAAKLADRLDASDHVRRKVHRDLVLWYTELGKREKAESEKQILFELVGEKNDSILYPQYGMCGHVVWWKTTPVHSHGFCGMG